ncbi:MAG: hypothetical protein GEV06_15620 [Luteitalea sp.]|nr:hypothetical protein [Luteitalea sp.]
MPHRRVTPLVGLVLILVIGRGSAAAQGQQAEIPEPVRDLIYTNVFYGGALPTATTAPVLVFVHGFGGTARYWWRNNDMYALAYLAAYRTAFISLSPDGTPNHESIEVNAVALRWRLPRILRHYRAQKLYLIGHSKGGVDIQAAMLDPATAALVRAVFTISSPNHGTELADWAFEHPQLAQKLNLLTPAVNSLRTSNMEGFRELADPILRKLGIPFFTTTGNRHTTNVVTLVTGGLLRDLVPGTHLDASNDGFVTVGRSRLSPEFATDLGVIPTHHFDTDTGTRVFTKIRARIHGLENTLQIFNRVATNGLSEFGGSEHSTWAWSVKWFKGKLYVGTASEALCMSVLTSDVRIGTNVYPSAVNTGQCPDYPDLVRSLGAEIWQYTPETNQWVRVFKSPNTIPLVDDQGRVVARTARDVGFRGMEVFVEPDGTEVLYAGGVTSGSVFEPMPFEPDGYAPPRLLRSVDGVSWAPVPQEPGTFLGEIGNVLVDEQTKLRSFRSLVSYNGQLFATIGDYVGVGVVVASPDPAAGNDAWRQVSPPRDEFPAWNLIAFAGSLYCTTGIGSSLGTLVTGAEEDDGPEGYGVYKTDAQGAPPYEWVPVVTKGGYQSDKRFRSPNGLSFAEFKGHLYVGMNRPTELIRIRPDDTWDLLVGEPRNTPDGYKAPLSGFGNGFGSWFNGHFWRMASDGEQLYLGTWDWSIGLQYLFPSLGFMEPLDKLFSHQYGFDLFRTADGIHWEVVTQTGLGDPNNSGVRSLESTPIGLVIGTARQRDGFQIFKAAVGTTQESPLPPTNLEADTQPDVVRLSWTPSPDAVRYRVYRAAVLPVDQLLQRTTLTIPTPDGKEIKTTLPGILAGELDSYCARKDQKPTSLCVAIDAAKRYGLQMGAAATNAETDPLPNAYPLPYELAAITTDTEFSEMAPSWLQSLYVVRAEDAAGVLSEPSNFVGAPSKAR